MTTEVKNCAQVFMDSGPRAANAALARNDSGGNLEPASALFPRTSRTEGATMLGTILIILLILILIGALPTWGYSGNWGYGPGGIVGVLLIIVIVLALTGRL
jgi:hypothetical protein